MATGGDSCCAQGVLARGLALQEELRSWAGPGSARLLKLVRGELAFVNRLSGLPVLPPSCPELRSSNFDHLEAVFSLLQNRRVSGVSAVMQSFAVPPASEESDSAEERDLPAKDEETGGGPVAHVDIVCMLQGKPVWLIISTRNPRYIMWSDSEKRIKGLRSRLDLLLKAACCDAVTQPSSILLCFLGDLEEEVDRGLRDEFGAVRGFALGEEDRAAQAVHLSSSSSSLESSMVVVNPSAIHQQEDDCNFSEVEGGEWLTIEVSNEDTQDEITPSPSPAWVTYDVGVAGFKEASQKGRKLSTSCFELQSRGAADLHGEAEEEEDRLSLIVQDTLNVHDPSLSSEEPESDECNPSSSCSMHDNMHSDDHTFSQGGAVDHALINLDTTALIARVSELSNGGAEQMLSLGREDMVKRYPSMATFIREQALSELDKPLVKQIEEAIANRQPVVCQYVHDEFNCIVSMIGGPKEQERAKMLLQRVRVVPNTPSERVMALPLTGKIKSRHKLVFGTGDQLKVPTLTANMAFVRAARQKGMAFEVVEHRPQALTGD